MTARVDDALEIGRLAALDPVSYEREREAAAEKLGESSAIIALQIHAAFGTVVGTNEPGSGSVD
jgi:hypothetical protein